MSATVYYNRKKYNKKSKRENSRHTERYTLSELYYFCYYLKDHITQIDKEGLGAIKTLFSKCLCNNLYEIMFLKSAFLYKTDIYQFF